MPLLDGAPYSSNSEVASSTGRPKKRRHGRPHRADGQDYDTDYNSSGDELDDNDFDRYKYIICAYISVQLKLVEVFRFFTLRLTH